MKFSSSLALTRHTKAESAAGAKSLAFKFRGHVTVADDKQSICVVTAFPLTDGRDAHQCDIVDSDGAVLQTTVETWPVPWTADIVTFKRNRYIVRQASSLGHAGSSERFTGATCELIQPSKLSA